MQKHTLAKILLISFLLPSALYAESVPLDCTGDNCGPVSIPNPNNMPTAGQAQPVGTAPGAPIEAPATPNKDPIAPNEPPAPGE